METNMKYLKLYEDVDFDDFDIEEEENPTRSHKDIPIYNKIGDTYTQKDVQRISGMILRCKSPAHLLRLSQTMANRITHIEKSIQRGNAAVAFDKVSKIYAVPTKVSKIFFDRAIKLYYDK